MVWRASRSVCLHASSKTRFPFLFNQLQSLLDRLRIVTTMVPKALDGLSADFLSPASIDFLPRARRLAADTPAKPSLDNVPDIVSLARKLQKPDKVESFPKHDMDISEETLAPNLKNLQN